MNPEDAAKYASSMHYKMWAIRNRGCTYPEAIAWHANVCDFLSSYAGKNSLFYKACKDLIGDEIQFASSGPDYVIEVLYATLDRFADHLKSGFHNAVPAGKKAQLLVVSDFLEMADALLADSDIHPAAPAVLTGATLEEFLRNWIKDEGLSLSERSEGINNFAQVLLKAELINKQDLKDLTAWAGIRNDASHGHWDKVTQEKVGIMLRGVDLFLKTYSPIASIKSE